MNIVEYVWQDAEGEIRGKTRILDKEFVGKPIPKWRFDGGSTGQATVDKSDCILNPVRVYTGDNVYPVVLCEVLDSNGDPHPTNNRKSLQYSFQTDREDTWVGVEQEFTISHFAGGPFSPHLNSSKQGNSYCFPTNLAENLVRTHMDLCLVYGIKYAGFNSEVTYGQWEYQIGPDDPVRVADDLVVSRYFLRRVFAYNNIAVTLHPKPFEDYNGAGCHINISTRGTRSGEDSLMNLAERFEEFHFEHMEAYGEHNELRMTGKHETSDYDEFSIGVGSRNTSIRIPDGDDGVYIEDRRPAANVDPYSAFHEILSTVNCKKEELGNE